MSGCLTLLNCLRVAEGCYDLGGGISPGSIRDNIVRANLFVDQLEYAGFLDKPAKVCIIGAGPTGVTLASLFSEFDQLELWLIDQRPAPLSLLALAEQRVISPSLFDWPAAHHRYMKYEGAATYAEGPPHLLREALSYELARAVDRGVVWVGGTSLTPLLEAGGPPWKVKVQPANNKVPATFDLLILCRGFGKERSIEIWNSNEPLSKRLEPFPFWSPDPYPVCGRRTLPEWSPTELTGLDCAVAVLGGGDGAVQDALRVLTNGLDTRAILNAITADVPERLDDLAGLLENAARYRAFSDATALSRASLEAIDELAEAIDSERHSRILSLIQCRSAGVFFRDETPGPAYPLNLFLALLFDECLKQEGTELLRSGFTVTYVRCRHSGDGHFNQEHELCFQQRKSIKCRVLIPRLGIDPLSVSSARPTGALYHCLPYWLPDWNPAA